MFLTKQHFEDSERVLRSYKESMDDDNLKLAIATGVAIDVFDNFESLKEKEKKDVLAMIMEDMAVSIYSIH